MKPHVNGPPSEKVLKEYTSRRSTKFRGVSHDMGLALTQAHANSFGEVIIGSGGEKEGGGRFDAIALSHDRRTICIYEAKGGYQQSTRIGLPDKVSAREVGFGIIAEQGSAKYVEAVLQTDPRLLDWLVANPDVGRGVLDGSVKLEYRMVLAATDGKGRMWDCDISDVDLTAFQSRLAKRVDSA